MKKFVMIATWCMSLDSMKSNYDALKSGKSGINEILVDSVKQVEDYPYYKSVGYGGLPNRQGNMQLDASFMEGNTMKIGAVAAVEGFANPIEMAYRLKDSEFNSFLVGTGAREYGLKNNFQMKNMLTERALHLYNKRNQEIEKLNLSPYSGHDTVCMLGMDIKGSISVATSTSGLFMKESGRVGDSPISGSGFYANSSYGACAATGLGEDIMKTCISYDVVMKLKSGMLPEQAAWTAVKEAKAELIEKYGKCGDISIVCCDADGNYGVATTIDEFSYVVMDANMKPQVRLVTKDGEHRKADEKWLANYFNERHKQLD